MITLRRAAIAAAILPLSLATAHAQDTYFSVFGGYAGITDQVFSGDVGGAPQTVENEFDGGNNLGVAIGRQFGTLGNGVGLRGEVELSYSESDVDQVFFSGNGPGAEANVSGDQSSTRLFANVYADFERGGAFTPFVGAGLGLANTQTDVVYGPGVRLDSSDTNVAVQLIAGADYAISERTSLFGDVRYIRDFGVETDRFLGSGALSGTLEEDIDTFQVNVGLRFNF